MNSGEAAIRETLIASNDHFRQLVSHHTELEQKLHRLCDQRFLSPEEQVEEARLKKEKLHVKDAMENLLHASLSHLSASN